MYIYTYNIFFFHSILITYSLYYYSIFNVVFFFFLCLIVGLPQHTKNRENVEIDGVGGGHRLVGLLVGALSAATVLAAASAAFVMVRRRRLIRQMSRRSRSASFQECTADKPHLPPAIHLTVSPVHTIYSCLGFSFVNPKIREIKIHSILEYGVYSLIGQKKKIRL